VRNSTNRERAVNKLTSKLRLLAAAATLSAAAGASAQQLFDWRSDPLGGAPVPTNFTPAPFLKDNGAGATNATAVGNYLGTQGVKAVKVDNAQAVTPATVTTVFGPRVVNYTFADFEGPTGAARFQALATQVKASAGTGPAIAANAAYIGNFDNAPIIGDPTRPGGAVTSTYNEYIASGANMANEALYPGSSSFKAPGQVAPGTGTSPNIRSSLFTLPIVRASFVTAALPAGHAHVPYVTRFNNVPLGIANDTYVNPNGVSQPSFVFDQAHGTAGQLLSRGDFSALVAHYRARGATGVHQLDGGVVGYTPAQFSQDTADGFNFAPFAQVFAGGNARLATLDTSVRVDGVVKTIENAGVVASGVYSLTQNGGAGRLALLLSNLDDAAHNVDFPAKIGGKTVPGTFQVLAGQHKLLEFTGAGTQWALQNVGGTPVFADANRDGVGVPEPMAMGGVALFALGMLGRRGRRTRTA
jgi:hypothetical protein